MIRRPGASDVYDVYYDGKAAGVVWSRLTDWAAKLMDGRKSTDHETGHEAIQWIVAQMEAGASRVANQAIREHRDLVTGATRRPSSPGAVETGRYVMRMRPEPGQPFQTVPVEREDLDPGRDRLGVTPSTKPYYRSEAAKQAKVERREEREAERRRKRIERGYAKGVRSTFSTPKKGAQEIYDANLDFYEPITQVADPADYVDDWFDRQEASVRGRWKSLKQTKRGRELYEAHKTTFGRPAVLDTLAYVLGKAKSKRWDDVDWRAIDDYNDALRKAYLAEEAHGHGVAGWKASFELPLAARGVPSEEEAAKAPPAAREQYIWIEASRELADVADRLDAAYKANRKYIKDPDHRKTIRERIKQIRAWAEDPAAIPEWACRARHLYCDFPAAWLELAEVQGASEKPYDPNWPLREIAEGKDATELGVLPTDVQPGAEPAVTEDLDLPWEMASNPDKRRTKLKRRLLR